MKTIIIKNYYYISYENFIELINLNPNLFSNIQNQDNKINNNNINNNTFLMKKRSPEYKNENILNEINKDKDNNNLNNYDTNLNLNLEKNDNIQIEINNNKLPKFFIEKKNTNKLNIKRRGRKPNISKKINYHTKYSNDNILRKIKVKFFHKIINYINSIILIKYKNKINFLKPLNGFISKNNKIEFNKNLINLKLKDIFSSYEINAKYKSLHKFYNKDIIKIIYNENIEELIEIFEMTFLDIFKIFRDINNTHKLKGIEKLDTVINELKNKENNEEYINKFIKVTMNFENFYLKKS